MKYLKMYEAFESSIITKMVGYLNRNKINSSSVKIFINSLKKIQNEFDIPLSKIKDKDVKYLNRVKALKLKNDNIVDNERGIYCLKFWFSLDKGYLGFTATGNYTNEFSSRLDNKLNIECINYIKNNLNIKTGKLTLVEDYSNLKHGQLIIGMFSHEYELERISLAKIWRYGDRLWALQNVAEGGEPNVDDERNWREWGFEYSWSLGSTSRPGTDHSKLNYYTPNDEPLSVEYNDDNNSDDVNPLNYNLPLNQNFQIGNWGNYDYSIDGYEDLDKADFSVIIILDDLLKSSDFKMVSKTKEERQESREGATKLLSDEDIRKMNINRYLSQIFKNMINLDTLEIKNLEKITLSAICDEFSFMSIYRNKPSLDFLDNMSSIFYKLIKASKEDKENLLKRAIGVYVQELKVKKDSYKRYKSSYKIVSDYFDIKEIKEFFDVLIRTGDYIKNYTENNKIENIEDIRMYETKLRSIRSIISEPEFYFSLTIRNIISDFYYPEDLDHYLVNKKINLEELSEDVTKIKHLERYIKSILR